MRVVVIGGTGHVGSFLVPRLVRGGHDVVVISRGASTPYTDDPEWTDVERVTADRADEDRTGVFADRVAALRADAVIDLVCFTLESATALVQRLRGEVGHLLHCGSVWRAGPSHVLPVSEENATPPFGRYGVQKDLIARMLKEETARGGLVTTSLHPGHISGPGWVPIGPTGNLDTSVWTTLSAGLPLQVPGLGAETMHHVHADDVAQAFERALAHRDAAAGEDFFITAPDAWSVRGYAELGASWFGQRAHLESVTWEQFRAGLSAQDGEASWEHLVRSHVFTIDKARRLIGYDPQHSAGQTVLDAVRWLVEHGSVQVAAPLLV
ncbi:NAD(P)-dependent oxidoreductase [Isoptericola sp. b441]|uniref:NAD(P)-dependent oxidoreductase n=1 Tax=Actinotalea lenta TaxID=3064654 RepID=A0ABT9D4P6_9CELL|nr:MULTISPECIES: NAD(P)-dependent oxidoreductase [unclassified Isoptericola]MDO8105674.1 NAD(P)-dependent oxidoreductase [Isoptericola sp. b441]MDO8122379.1 NAD(P)-dependent oxidoreductase [Isoptericola sp. b490]